MKRTLKILSWGTLIAASICLGLWQYKNICIVAREYYSLNYHFNSKGAIVERIIPQKANINLELTAVARVSIRLWNTQLSDCLPEIAQYAIEFPNNQFFLYQVAVGCSDHPYNPEVSLLCANRLIELDPNNGLYHYVKAWSLLLNRKGDDIEPALIELEKANSSSKCEDPLESFRPALIALAESGKIRRGYVETAFHPWPLHSWYSHILRQELLRYSASAITNNNMPLAFRIDDDILALDKRIPHSRVWQFGFGAAMHEEPAALELLCANLSPDRAWRNRMLLVERYVPPKQKKTEISKDKHESISSLLFAPGTAFIQLVLGYSLITVYLALVCLIGGFRNSASIGFKHYGFFIFAVLTYVFSYTFCEYSLHQSNLDCCYSYYDEFRPQQIHVGSLWEAFSEDFFESFAMVVILTLSACAPLIAIGANRLLYIVIQKLPESVQDWAQRICSGLLIASVAFVLAHLGFPNFYFFEHNWFNYAFYVFLFVGGLLFKSRFLWISLFASVLAVTSSIFGYYFFYRLFAAGCFLLLSILYCLAYEQKKLEIIKQFFLRTNSNRWPVLELAMAGFILSWLGFLCFVPALAGAITYNSEPLPAPQSAKHERPPATVIYKDLIQRLRSEPNITESDFRAITLLEPNDARDILPYVMSKAPKTKPKLRSPSDFMQFRMQFRLSDYRLYQNAANSPRQAAELFIPYFKNPDSNAAAVAKAFAGDRSQLPRLFALYNIHIEAKKHPPEPPKRSPETGKLSLPYLPESEPDNPYISDVVRAIMLLDPNEAAKFLVEEITNQPIDIVDTCHISQYMYLLPRKQLDMVIEAYVDRLLSQRKDSQQRIDGGNDDMLAMAQTTVADKILRIVSDDFSERDFVFFCGLEPKLDKTAMPILKQGLASNNPKLQAWCLWQINKIEPTAELNFDKIINDTEPAVRANAILFDKCPRPKQPDSLCELIRKLKVR
jgi:hypothetical protein